MAPAHKKPKSEEPGVLFIRNVPSEVLAGLDAEIERLEKSDELYRGLSRAALALKLIRDGLRAMKTARP